MIPLYDDNPTRRFPFLTVGLIVVNVLVFAYEFQVLASGGENAFSELLLRAGLVPVELVRWTDVGPPLLVPLPFTVLTSMFMHGDFMHLGGNMLYLWIFGNNIEDELGTIGYLLFYLLAGIAAAAAQIAFALDSEIPMVGASGAIAGVLGAYLVRWPHAKVRSLIFLFYFVRLADIPAGVLLGFWFVAQIASSLMGREAGVAWWAHIGGFAFGAIAMFLLRGRGRGPIRRRNVDRFDPWG